MSTPPIIVFREFAPSGINPSGTRTTSLSPSFVKVLGTTPGSFMDFGSKNLKNGKQHSKTTVFIAYASNFNDATEAIFNMRFFVSDFSAFDTGTYFFNGFPSGKWIQNIKLTDASGKFVPTIIPSGQNIWRDCGGPFNRNDLGFQELVSSGVDVSGMPSQVTMPFYLSVTVDTDVPAKVHGGDAGNFTFRMNFDYR